MEESFELLSSMSPKVKGGQKHFRQGAMLQALRLSIETSDCDESQQETSDENVIVIESSIENFKTAASDNKLLNKTPIVISDTDLSDEEIYLSSSKNEVQNMCKTDQIQVRSDHSRDISIDRLLPNDKLDDIKNWITRVNAETNIKEDTTMYSELSTIYGEEIGVNFNPEGTGAAANSTFVYSRHKRFDQLFKSDKQKLKASEVAETGDSVGRVSQGIEKMIVDDSFTNENKSSDKNINETWREDMKDYIKRDCGSNSSSDGGIIEQTFVIPNDHLNINFSRKKSRKKIDVLNVDYGIQNDERKNTNFKTEVKETPIKEQTECDEDLISVLDDLYGDSWRQNEEQVLPKSEPRRKLEKPSIFTANTERKPKFSIAHKNPYLDVEQSKSSKLLENLHRSRLKNNLRSSHLQRLKMLCDSDTNSENSQSKCNARVKLDFDDSDSDCENINQRKSKYFGKGSNDLKVDKEVGSDKENLDDIDFSYLGESLEERIRKKMNKIKVVPDNKTKKSTKTPRENKIVSKGKTKDSSNKKGNKADPIVQKTNSIESSSSNEAVRDYKTDDKRLSSKDCSESSEDDWDREIKKLSRKSQLINGAYDFLTSLSENIPLLQCDMSARIYRNNFKTYKNELLKKLFKLYNERVFDNKIPDDTVLEWNDRMRGTAGFCYCRKITRRNGVVERTARIVLATKVVDAAYRLRDTLLHEMCHAATWIVNCVSDGHGAYWKAWAYKAMKTFPELPPIKRCHDYVVNTKYTYKCTGCGYCIGRHTKSLDIERKRCGHCYGTFEVLLNKTSKKGEVKSVPATPKKEATGFALFVKENYAAYRNDGRKHGDVMKILGQKFQALKMVPR